MWNVELHSTVLDADDSSENKLRIIPFDVIRTTTN